MIKVSNINKYYNKNKDNQIHVLKDVSLELPEKGLVAILGKSGSGKTTLLNIIGGLDNYNSGRLEIDSHISSNPESMDILRSKKIGCIFQNYNLIDNKTVNENLEIALRIAGLEDKNEQAKRIDYVLSLVDLIKYKKRKANTLSGGQQQRIGIARALVKGPSIIIADEPTGNLDSDNTFIIMDLLKSISKECLVVLVTHEEEIANFFADRIIRISDGKVIDDYINDCNNDLVVKDNKKIFLKDLTIHNNIRQNNFNIEMVSDRDYDFKLKLVFKDDKLYIDTFNTNLPVSLVDAKSEIKLVDSNYEDKKKVKHKTVDIDSGILKEIQTTQKLRLSNLMTSIVKSWKNYYNKPFKKKFPQHLILFFSATLFTFLTVMLGSNLIYDESSYDYNKNIVVLERHGNSIDINDIIDIEGENGIIKVIFNGNIQFNNIVNLKTNNDNTSNIHVQTHTFPLSCLGEHAVVIGNLPSKDSEAIVDIKLLSSENDRNRYRFGHYNNLYEFNIKDARMLLGETYYFNGKSFVISGVVDSEYRGAWISDDVYTPDESGSYQIHVLCNDKEEFKNFAATKGYYARDVYEFEKMHFVNNRTELIITISIIFVISLIFMYIMLSNNVKYSFLNNLKEIGIFRALGVRKREMIREHIFENLFVLIFSGGIAIFATMMLVRVLKPYSMYTVFENFSSGRINAIAYLAVIVMLTLINIGVTLFKSSMLLRNTPAEILSKYDI